MQFGRLIVPNILCLMLVMPMVSFAQPSDREPGAHSQQSITDSAVWNPDDAAQRRLFQECGSAQNGTPRKACVSRVMRSSGASSEATAFTEAQDGLVYISAWRPDEAAILKTGKVDVARVICTFGTNFNCGYSYILVNGSPQSIPVSIDPKGPGFGQGPGFPDLEALWDDIRSDPTYQSLTSDSNEPFVTNVWGGEDVFVESRDEPDGGQTLLFWSPIKSCHPCDVAGKIYVAYQFDESGTFQERSLERIVAS